MEKPERGEDGKEKWKKKMNRRKSRSTLQNFVQYPA
jgi:hypothetical protein